MAKLERLLNLTAALLATERPLTAQDLRHQLEGYAASDEGFRRAFERDKKALRDMGIPIEVVDVPGTDPPVEGYRIDPEEYGQQAALEPDELAALHLAASLVRIEGLDDEAFWKLGGAGGGESAAAQGVRAELPSDPNLPPLFKAATDRTRVRFDYHGETRTVDAWRLSFARGHWYLSGFDHARDAERLFRVDRIESEVVPGEHYAGEPPDRPILLRGWEIGDAEPETATLLVDAPQVTLVTNELGEDRLVERRPDGSAVFTLSVRDRDAFVSFVLTLLERVEVLSPPELRQAVIDRLDAVIARGPGAA